MIPFYFGTANRRLFGAHHPAASGSGSARALVLCNPFGHEAIRAHRLFRVLAERLSRAGTHVLRFDYFGTGDSQGDDEEGDLDGWSDDLRSAHRELRERSGVDNIGWLGARLGATVAICALRNRAAEPAYPSRLIVWDPVLDGPGYLKALRGLHVDALETSYSLPEPAWRRILSGPTEAFADEAIGFAISPTLRAQLREVNVRSLGLNGAARVDVIADPSNASAAEWVALQRTAGAAVRTVPLVHSMVWTSDDSLNSALVPGEAVQKLVSTCDD